jgi:hypothetical protein
MYDQRFEHLRRSTLRVVASERLAVTPRASKPHQGIHPCLLARGRVVLDEGTAPLQPTPKEANPLVSQTDRRRIEMRDAPRWDRPRAVTRWRDNAANAGSAFWAGFAAVLLCPPVAGAQDVASTCADPRITVEDGVDARWTEPLARLCKQLATWHDVDPSARLHVVAAGQDVIIEARLGDGRTALRRIHAPDDLSLTVEALTLLPRTEPNASARLAAEPAVPVAVPVAPGPPVAAAAHRIGVEIGGAITGRIERAPTYLASGIEGYANVRLDTALLGLMIRWDFFETLATDPLPLFEMDSVGVGFLFARRLGIARAVDLDIGGNALLMVQTQGATPSTVELSDADADVRVGLLARALFGQAQWRWTLSLETDFSPARLRRSNRVAANFPTLPVWSLGVGLGTLWERS